MHVCQCQHYGEFLFKSFTFRVFSNFYKKSMYCFTIITELFLSTNHTLLGGSTSQQSKNKRLPFLALMDQFVADQSFISKQLENLLLFCIWQSQPTTLPSVHSFDYTQLNYCSFTFYLAVSLFQDLDHLFLYIFFLEEFPPIRWLSYHFYKDE